jgi:hypothetical protein
LSGPQAAVYSVQYRATVFFGEGDAQRWNFQGALQEVHPTIRLQVCVFPIESSDGRPSNSAPVEHYFGKRRNSFDND